MPIALELRYPSETVLVPSGQAELSQVERDLAKAIESARSAVSQRPATAHPGESCGYCDARPFCDAYWDLLPPWDPRLASPAPAKTGIDLEVTVDSDVIGGGFEAKTPSGRTISVVGEPDEIRALGNVLCGENLRIIAASPRREGGGIELKAWTEVFRVGQ